MPQLVDRADRHNRAALVDGTAVLVGEIAAPANGNRIVYDTVVTGLGCRVTARGARAYVLNYRVRRGPKAGTERRYTIGAITDWSIAAARTEAKRLKQLIDQGGDPVGEEKRDREAPTVTKLCERFITDHVENKKPRTRAEYTRLVERIIKPKLGRLKVEAVESEDIERLHRELKPTPRQANHVVAVLSKMFNLAERWKLRPLNSNPCRHLERYSETERDRYPKPEELERIGAAIRTMAPERAISAGDVACIQFLALVGCRLSEAVALDLADVDFRTGAWTLRDAKAGDRIVMLGAPALALLVGLDRTTGRAFVRADDTPVTINTVEKAWAGIRTRAAVPDLRLHDLRHGVGTYAGAAGLNAFLVRDLLGHRTLAMTGRYVSKHVDPLRAAADTVAGQIAAAMERPPAEVVEMPKAGRR
jgi:integrase